MFSEANEEEEELLRLTQHPSIGYVVEGILSRLSSLGTAARERDFLKALNAIKNMVTNVGSQRQRLGRLLVAISNIISSYHVPRQYLMSVMSTILEVAPPALKSVIKNIVHVVIMNHIENDARTESGQPSRVTRKNYIRMLSKSSVVSKCPVCMEKSSEISDDAICLPCEHSYHRECITPWLEHHNTCPLCRYELPSNSCKFSRYERDRRKRMRLKFPRAEEPEVRLAVSSELHKWWNVDEGKEFCPSGKHKMVSFHAPRDSFECDICNDMQEKGAFLYGCRDCNFDVCDFCWNQRINNKNNYLFYNNY